MATEIIRISTVWNGKREEKAWVGRWVERSVRCRVTAGCFWIIITVVIEKDERWSGLKTTVVS